MDPDANLAEQLRLSGRIERAQELCLPPNLQDVYRLTELIKALDEWIRHGGFLPQSWERRRVATRSQ